MSEPYPSAEPKRALFVFSIQSFYREMFPVATHFANNGFEVHVLLGWSGIQVDEAQAKCRAANLTVHYVPADLRFNMPRTEQTNSPQAALSVRPQCSLKGVLKVLFSPLLGVDFLQGIRRSVGLIIDELDKHRRVRSYSRELVDELHPAIVLCGPFSVHGEFENGIARECRQRRIPLVCLPTFVAMGGCQMVVARVNAIELGQIPLGLLEADLTPARRVLKRLFPAWTREYNGKCIFLWAPYTMFLAWLTGLMEDDPWQRPSQWFDIVFAEAELTVALLAEINYDLHKVIVCGKPILDEAFERLADERYMEALYSYLKLEIGEPFILFNVEPSAEHKYRTWEEHWKNFTDLMECLKHTGYKVILSLHPLCNTNDYRFVEQKYGFRISEKYGIGLLFPYANVVVSFPCSTNFFSLAFNRKIIMYDFLGQTKDDYPTHNTFRVPNAAYIYTVDQLREELHAFAMTEEFRCPLGTIPKPRNPASVIIRQVVAERYAI